MIKKEQRDADLKYLYGVLKGYKTRIDNLKVEVSNKPISKTKEKREKLNRTKKALARVERVIAYIKFINTLDID